MSKPKSKTSPNLDKWIVWKEVKLFPYNSLEEKMIFMQHKGKYLNRYNFGNYKNVIIFSELEKFLGKNLTYHKDKIIEEGWLVYNTNRSDFQRYKKFISLKGADTHILLLPYQSFWALLEKNRDDIAKSILKELHAEDLKRELENDKNQTLIAQIKGEKVRSQILFEELNKCDTLPQKAVFTIIFERFPQARVEYAFYDPTKNWEWRVDIILGDLIFELDGGQHRHNDERFNLDEDKDTFMFENGKYVFRRSNGWYERNWKELWKIITIHLNKRFNK